MRRNFSRTQFTQPNWIAICLAGVTFFIASFANSFVQRAIAQSKNEKSKVSLKDTKADIKAFSKRMDSAQDDLERTEAIVDLASLYLKIVGDHRFAQSERLQGNRGRIAARLQKYNKQIQRELRKSELEKRKQQQLARRNRNKTKSKRTDSDEAERSTDSTVSTEIAKLRSAVVDPHWKLLSQAGGGVGPSMYYGSGLDGTAGHFWRNQGHFAGEPNDNGFELVDLIETILHPDFWQTNGGSGMAYYYRPLRILVVRATTTVHEDLEHFLERLR